MPLDSEIYLSPTISKPERLRSLAKIFSKSISELMLIAPREITFLISSNDDYPSVYDLKPLVESPAIEKKTDKIRLVMAVVYLLNCLSHEYGLTLWKSFFLAREEMWWKDRYSKSGYYRMRKQALNQFFTISDAQ